MMENPAYSRKSYGMAKSGNFSSPNFTHLPKNKWISARKAHATDDTSDLFNLPIFVEAFEQLQELEAEFYAMALTPSNDSWTYIWG